MDHIVPALTRSSAARDRCTGARRPPSSTGRVPLLACAMRRSGCSDVRTGTIEVDHLNGEIVRIARLHRVAAPVNQEPQRLSRRAVAAAWPPAAIEAGDLLALLEAAA